MKITLLGLVLIPLSLIWAFNPVRLLQLALLSSVFEAAAAMIFGGFGLQPAMVPGVLFISYIVLQYALGMRYPGERAALSAMLPLLALLFYAILSAWLLPDAFDGEILVWPQKTDPLDFGFVPLHFSFGNVTQTLYLAFNVAFATSVAVFLTRSTVPAGTIIGAYMLGGYVVVALVFWQLASSLVGLPFPDGVLYSNPGWAIVSQSLGSVPRLQGPFTEPAGLAFFLSGLFFCCLWLSVRGYRIMNPSLLLALSAVAMLLSTSTTGIVTMLAGLPVVMAVGSIGRDPTAVQRIWRTLGMIVLGGSIILIPLFILKPSLADAVDTVVQSTLSKGDSESFDQRSEIDSAAMSTFAPTAGLGVGWGSFRSSSFVPGMLANAGAFGVVMVAWMVLGLRRFARRGRLTAPGHPNRALLDGFSAALCGQFVAALISAPMIDSHAFYLQIGCVVGVGARMLNEKRLQPA